MTAEQNNTSHSGAEGSDELLEKLFRLKRYETPEVARMTRSKQNIMRQVREISRSKRKNVWDRLEMSFPWLFAEPKYGVAALFVAFAGLQYLGVNARHASQSSTGIYSVAANRFSAYEQTASVVSNSVKYAEVTPGMRLLSSPEPEQVNKVEWANYWK